MRVCVNGRVFDTRKGDVVILELADEGERNLILGTVLLSQYKRIGVNPVAERPAGPPAVTADAQAAVGRALGMGPAPLFTEKETENAWRFIDRIQEGART